MKKYTLLHSYVFIIFLVLFLPVYASQYKFDLESSVKIRSSFGSVEEDYEESKWIARRFITINNGFFVVYQTLWNDEASAIAASEEEYFGKVNIVHAPSESADFALVLEYEDLVLPVSLVFDSCQHLNKPPRIKSITENGGNGYSYIIELNDNTIWSKKESEKAWQPWEFGTRVLKIGNSHSQCLINIDDLSSESNDITSNDFIWDIERLH